MESLCQEPGAHTCSGNTDIPPQLGLIAYVPLAFLCSLRGPSPGLWDGGLVWNFSRILVGFGVVCFCSFFVLAQRVAEPGMGQQSRAALLWGCRAMCGAGDVWGKLPHPSSIPAAFGMVWEVAHGSVHSLWNQSLPVGWGGLVCVCVLGISLRRGWFLFAGRRGQGESCCAPGGLWQRSLAEFP